MLNLYYFIIQRQVQELGLQVALAYPSDDRVLKIDIFHGVSPKKHCNGIGLYYTRKEIDRG